MTFRYRYLGMRGIFIGKKHYHNDAIIEVEKPIEEYGFSPLLFKDLTGRAERMRVQHQIDDKKEAVEKSEKEKEQELKKLEKKYDRHIAHLKKELRELKRIWKEQFEPKLPKPIVKTTKKGGK